MSDFFEVPESERPPAPQRYRSVPWFDAPPGMLPGVVATELVVCRTDRAAVFIPQIACYSAGLLIEMVAIDGERGDYDPMGSGPEPDVRIGYVTSEGKSATNLPRRRDLHPGRQPEGPVLHTRGGSSSHQRQRHQLWAWPLPPAGMLQIICEWPRLDGPRTTTELDATVLREAAEREQVIFTDDHLPGFEEAGEQC